MTSVFTAACVQVNAGNDLTANAEAAAGAVADAARAGAGFVALPENVCLMPADVADARANALPEESHPAVAALRAAAKDAGVWLLAGSVGVDADGGRLANRSLLIAPDGAVAARYDKIHMFDADIPEERTYRESDTYRPGGRAVVAALPWAGLGMTVCYDLRFPALYRALAQAGAELLAVPSAFTATTGQAHWHVLLRARAIETGCYVLAPAQCGSHPGGRRTFGHSLIVSPWGEVIAEAGDEPAILTAELDPARVAEARRRIPSLANDRAYTLP